MCVCVYSKIKPLATLSERLLDVTLRTDSESILPHHPPVTFCTWGTRVLVRHARDTEQKSLILIALKCHKYAQTVLIFYGNRKSID